VAPSGSEQGNGNVYIETYLHTAKNLIRVLQQLPQIKHLIYTSSCSVYGDTNGEWVSEDSELAPVSQQAHVLYETEQILLQVASEQLRVCILRLGGIYGLGRMLSEYSSLCGTSLPGTGENFTNWSHLDDIVAGIGFVIQNQLHGIYNLVNDKPVLSSCIKNQKLKASGYKLIHSEVQI
jgi:nucleoside-diphosphate-sugar epimerase